jgi:hypothetical protein
MKSFVSQRVTADAAGWNSRITEQLRDVSKVGGSATELFARGE